MNGHLFFWLKAELPGTQDWRTGVERSEAGGLAAWSEPPSERCDPDSAVLAQRWTYSQ